MKNTIVNKVNIMYSYYCMNKYNILFLNTVCIYYFKKKRRRRTARFKIKVHRGVYYVLLDFTISLCVRFFLDGVLRRPVCYINIFT